MLTNLKKRVEKLEETKPNAYKSDLRERIAKYRRVLDTEDYSSTEGKEMLQMIEKYKDAIAEMDKF